jgi:hypothetical protein
MSGQTVGDIADGYAGVFHDRDIREYSVDADGIPPSFG